MSRKTRFLPFLIIFIFTGELAIGIGHAVQGEFTSALPWGVFGIALGVVSIFVRRHNERLISARLAAVAAPDYVAPPTEAADLAKRVKYMYRRVYPMYFLGAVAGLAIGLFGPLDWRVGGFGVLAASILMALRFPLMMRKQIKRARAIGLLSNESHPTT